MPAHYLHMYQKPKLGSDFIKRFQTFNYRHKISANGWFDTASCDIRLGSADEAQQFLDQNIGNRVAIYVDNPVEPVWEGFINRMTFAAGGWQYTISLDEMENSVDVTYAINGSVTPTWGAANTNTDSQAIYGIKHGRSDLGFQYAAGTGATVLQGSIINQRAWPKASTMQGDGSGLVTLELLGVWYTLGWDVYSDTNTTTPAINTFISTMILPAIANGTTFFNNADTTLISTNATTVPRNRRRGSTAMQVLQELAEIGDGANYYVIGITPTNPNTGTRSLYYRAQNTDILYTARRRDGLRIRNPYGKLERPWTIRPDCGIRITDMLPGWNGQGDDPRETWISSIDYDAEAQSVTWVGDDNVTAEGAFGLARQVKRHGVPFGAVPRFT